MADLLLSLFCDPFKGVILCGLCFAIGLLLVGLWNTARAVVRGVVK